MPFDMVVLNDLDRYRLTLDVMSRVPLLKDRIASEPDRYWTMTERHQLSVAEHGEDMPKVRDWRWWI